MNVIKLVLILIAIVFTCTGCRYWPQVLEPDYYKDSVQDMKEDIDDVAGSRTIAP